MAIVDAVARSLDLPLWKFFGGAASCLTTDITVSKLVGMVWVVCEGLLLENGGQKGGGELMKRVRASVSFEEDEATGGLWVGIGVVGRGR